MRPRPAEVKALVALLEQDWETPEVLAAALIEALDSNRASRITWVGVAQFGPPRMSGATWYSAVGPYPGRKSAEKALRSHPAASLASYLAVVPLTSPDGLRERLRSVDEKPRKESA